MKEWICKECGEEIISIIHKCNPFIKAKYQKEFHWDKNSVIGYSSNTGGKK